ncbi:integrase [Phyllobacterium sp. 1468]|uniref:tyrosine-type recombinase/integrase n=1 Tax=Phyllobacterium sp. 1468 TaxID=2817759 RepID=UPI002866B2F6|nr:tyrosine-type recombinase/integrase [Phyllobacterium sp. 1468]MDR6634204.1 integrase [Phyllobacterium sp. 1468]
MPTITDTGFKTGAYKPKLGPDGQKKLTYYPDAGKPGLVLAVQPSGKMSWVIFYRRLSDRKQRKYTLDGFPSIKVAHKLAQDVLNDVSNGNDPAGDKQEKRQAAKLGVPDSDKFSALVETYLNSYKKGSAIKRKTPKLPKPRTIIETARNLGMRPDGDGWEIIKRDTSKDEPLRPAEAWGEKRMQDIRERDVIVLHDSLEQLAGPYTANRTYAALSPLFAWAIRRKMIKADESPMGAWDFHPETKGERVLSNDEIRWFWLATGEMGGEFGPMFRLLLLTGQRREEVASAEWSEFNLPERLWTIPASKTKNGREQEVPLSDGALAVIEGLKLRGENPRYLFTTTGETHVTGFSRAKITLDKKMAAIAEKERGEPVTIPDWRLHDLRRTVSTKMNDEDSLGILPHVVEAVLNHAIKAKQGVAGTYNQAKWRKPKADALQAWGQFIAVLVADNVVRLERVV